MPEIRLICDDQNLCGEGPLWDPAQHRLIWNDCSSSLLFEYVPQTGRKRIVHRGLMIAGAALNHDGRLVVCGATGLHLWEDHDKLLSLLSRFDGEDLFFNDMIAEPTGGVYAGTIYWGADGMQKTGKLYHISPELRVSVVQDGVQLANGLGFSPDRRTLYFADSAARTIDAYDLRPNDPIPRNRRVFVHVGADEGIPDGLTVDSQGFVWSAQWYGSQIVRYDPDGTVERRIEMPVRQVSSLAFGGDDLCDLYITTAGEHSPGPLAPVGYDFDSPNRGGGLYCMRSEVPGLREMTARFTQTESEKL